MAKLMAEFINIEQDKIINNKSITVQQASGFLNLSAWPLFRLTSSREIPFFKPGGKRNCLDIARLSNSPFSNRIALADFKAAVQQSRQPQNKHCHNLGTGNGL